MLPLFYRFFLLFLPLFVAGCTVPANQPPLSGDLANSHSQSRPPSTGGRIHFWLGKTFSGGLILSEIDMRQPADFFIDGRNIGGVNYGEVLVFEVPAGRYRLSWAERANASSPLQSPNIELTVQNGDLIYLRTYLDVSAGAGLGLLGAAINPPRATLQHILNGGSQMISSLRPVSVTNSEFNATFRRSPQTVLPNNTSAQPSVGRTAEARLRDLMRLRDLGLINASEYEQRRINILNGL